MSTYHIALFLHVLGALGVFAALGIEWAAAGALRRAANAEEARPWTGLLASQRRLGGPSALTILVTGVYMTSSAWGRQPWIGLSLVGLVALAVVGAVLTGRRMAAIARDLRSSSDRDESIRLRLRDPMLVVSLRLRTAIALGIIFLMTTKPAAAIALAGLGTALVLGLAWSVPALGRRTPDAQAAP